MRVMRTLVMMMALMWLLPVSAAQACMGAMLEDTIFFEKMPEKPLDADIVAKVTLGNVIHDGIIASATARVSEVVKGNLSIGDKILLRYVVSSCGPNHQFGGSGLIIVKRTGVVNGEPAYTPYTRNFVGTRIGFPIATESSH